MAKLEKAILDYLYLNPIFNQVVDFEGLRWNKGQLTSLIDQAVFKTYLEIFNKTALMNRVESLKEYLNA